MLLTLLSHQWKSFWRSRNAGRSLAVQIIVGFFVVYLLCILLAAGIGLPFVLHKLYKGQDIIPIFCGYILYYYAFDIIFRFTMQELPVLTIQPYLGQNIPRSKLVAFLNWRCLFHFLNLCPLLLFLPFTFMEIGPKYGPAKALLFVIAFIFITLFCNFLVLYIKRRTIVSSWWLTGFFLAISAMIALDYFKVIPTATWSSHAFLNIMTTGVTVLIPILLGLVAWLNNSRFLRKNLYLDEGRKEEKAKTSKEYSWLQQLGLAGEIIALDIKLMLRNQRPKYILRMSVFFLAYGLIFYTPQNLANPHMYIFLFVGIFMTGMFIMNFGQFLFAWHSAHFDGLMTANISMETWIRSKFILFTVFSTLTWIVISLYGFISWKILLTQTASWLYNIGINTVISVWLATWHFKKMDLNTKASFNFQGTSTVQFAGSFGLMIFPYLIFFPLNKWVDPWVAYGVIGGLGLINLLLRGWWIKFLAGQLQKRKYYILEGFRQ